MVWRVGADPEQPAPSTESGYDREFGLLDVGCSDFLRPVCQPVPDAAELDIVAHVVAIKVKSRHVQRTVCAMRKRTRRTWRTTDRPRFLLDPV